ncbi:hypothetical protein FOCG_14368 [Fusarium oxysporum f. sp. radicis-lycopersici 26381]|nr:hypothetical protein FOWG_10314 [Fusarium oxysporum f. sp. lycopersici MN25]EXL44218.1 hypothetical protein FOCG_14368 [Fusarium oxysporum f. sp. radicis-lycopersici 26381]
MRLFRQQARIGQASGLGPPDAQDARSMGEQWGLRSYMRDMFSLLKQRLDDRSRDLKPQTLPIDDTVAPEE